MPDVELLYLMVSLAASTLVSEDLACIAAGLLVSQGGISFMEASAACFLGIFVGDILLFMAGRQFGRRVLEVRPFSWFVDEAAIDRASAWFSNRGAVVVFISRFTPGLRLPTYFTAGILRTNPLTFASYFGLACLVWAPSLVWFASQFGNRANELLNQFDDHVLLIMVSLGALIFIMTRLIVPLFSWRGRRLMLGALRRQTRWEYWPRWRLYLPVIPTIIFQAVKHRSLRVVTAVNPCMEGGGLVGESKSEVLAKLEGPGIPPSVFLGIDARNDRLSILEEWRQQQGVDYPLVLKPNRGERGFGVSKIANKTEASAWFEEFKRDAIAQPFIDGLEFGISYLRFQGQEKGRVISISEKQPPAVVGDGVATIEELILRHPRHVALASRLMEGNAERLFKVPKADEEVQLSPLGTHSRGAEFIDRNDLHTEALEQAIDSISRRSPGFHLGRYDLRVPSAEDLKAGCKLQVLELNGLTGEPGHIYDARHSVRKARRELRRCWRDAFAIGQGNAQQGARVSSFSELWGLLQASR